MWIDQLDGNTRSASQIILNTRHIIFLIQSLKLTKARRLRTKRLNRADLPTLGLPTSATCKHNKEHSGGKWMCAAMHTLLALNTLIMRIPWAGGSRCCWGRPRCSRQLMLQRAVSLLTLLHSCMLLAPVCTRVVAPVSRSCHVMLSHAATSRELTL